MISLRRLIKPHKKYAYIQVSRMKELEKSSSRPETESKNLGTFIKNEVKAFTRWAGLKPDSLDYNINIISPNEYIYVIISTYEPDYNDIQPHDIAGKILWDVQEAIHADKDTYEGDDLSKRCRWIVKHE